MSGLYLWLKAFHVIAVIAWMAAFLYLPRLFVYHCRAEPGSATSETFKVMERRLHRFIMTPAMMASWALGLSLVWLIGRAAFEQGWWLIVKLVLVLCLTALHFRLVSHAQDFQTDRNRHSERYFRMINEVPALLMIGIVIMVIVRPF